MFDLLSQSQSGGNPLALLLPFVLLGGVFYFMILRPQQRRAKAQQALVNSIEVGDEVVTTAGVFAIVTEIDDEEGTVIVQIAPGVEVRMLRAGIGRRVMDEDEVYDEDEDGDDDHDEPGDDSAGDADGGASQGPTQEQ